MSKKVQYEGSDAWLLLAIVYASKSGGANIKRIIEIGDGINHAIFTDEELEGGLSRLTSGGLVKESDGIFIPAKQVIKRHSQKTSARRGIHKELRDMEQFLVVDR